MKGRASFAVVGTYCSGFHDGGSKRRSYYPEQLLSDEPEYRPSLGRLRLGVSSHAVGSLCAEPLGLPPISALLWISSALSYYGGGYYPYWRHRYWYGY